MFQIAPTGEGMLSRIRNTDSASLAAGGVLIAEAMGFFTIGECLGRMKLIGYHGPERAHETATPHGDN